LNHSDRGQAIFLRHPCLTASKLTSAKYTFMMSTTWCLGRQSDYFE
jgi:hypothetical protein